MLNFEQYKREQDEAEAALFDIHAARHLRTGK